MILQNRVYNALKFIALVLLPGAGALYFGLAQIWGLPHAEEVVGTVTVVDTFLGLLLKSSSSSYQKQEDAKTEAMLDGELMVQHVDGEVYPALGGKVPFNQLVEGKDHVTLKVVHYNPEHAAPEQ